MVCLYPDKTSRYGDTQEDISPMTSVRRLRMTFEKTDALVDMAHSFLYVKQTRQVIKRDIRIAFLLIIVCLLFDKVSVI